MKSIIKQIIKLSGLSIALLFISYLILRFSPFVSPETNALLIVLISLLALFSGKYFWNRFRRYIQYRSAKPVDSSNVKISEEKIFLITGANRGIGLALVKELIAMGHTIIATARDLSTSQKLSELSPKVFILDVSDNKSIESFSKKIADQKIDYLINNAVEGPVNQRIAELHIDGLEKAFQTNVIGVCKLIQCLLPNLQKSSEKKIINISSDLGSFNRMNPCLLYGYQTSKAALNMLTLLLSKELSPKGFCCLAIHPGPVNTRLNPEGVLSTEESAKAIINVISQLKKSDSGKWFDYKGKIVPW